MQFVGVVVVRRAATGTFSDTRVFAGKKIGEKESNVGGPDAAGALFFTVILRP